jgi:carbamoyl-phosphate synthase small subunit
VARAALALEDGTVYFGESFGATGTVSGEVCFNTSMTGYQEILTDPSYRGQILTMTAPQIGNYGVNPSDVESGKLQMAGFIVREASRITSNFTATDTLGHYLAQAGVVGLAGIDTRALVRRLRIRGAMTGVVSSEVLDAARRSAATLGLTAADRIMSAQPWSTDAEITDNLLAVFAAGASLVLLANPDPALLDRRRATEKVTRTLDSS